MRKYFFTMLKMMISTIYVVADLVLDVSPLVDYSIECKDPLLIISKNEKGFYKIA